MSSHAAAVASVHGDAEATKTKTALASPPSNNHKTSNGRSIQDGAPKVIIGMLTSTRARKRKGSSTVLAIGASRKAPPTAATASADEEERQQEDGIEGKAATVNYSSTALVPTEQQQTPSNIKDHLPQELIPPVIPQNTTGQPSLKAFCIAHPKRKKARPAKRKNKNDNPKQNHRRGDKPLVSLLTGNNAANISTLPNQQQQQQQQPTVQIVNGEIVLQESSVVFHGVGAGTHTNDDAHQQTNTNNSLTIVEEESEMAVVRSTYQSYATGKRACHGTHHWTVDETQLFYDALRQVGVDFGSMEFFFNSPQQGPSNDNDGDTNDNNNTSIIRQRNRRQLKNKYAAELKRNPRLVERALHPKGRVGIDLSVFELTPEQVEEMAVQQKQLQGEEEQQQELAMAKGLDQGEQIVDGILKGSEEVDEVNIESPAEPDSYPRKLHDSFWHHSKHQQTSSSSNPINDADADDDVVEDPGFAEDESCMDAFFVNRVNDANNHPQAEVDKEASATASAPSLPTLVHKKKIAKPKYRASAAVARKKQKK